MHSGFGGECEILLVELTILASRDRIIGITFRAGVFVDDAGLRVLLAGQVFELSYACELVIVRIVYDRNGLILRLVQGLVSELQTAVWQSPKLKIEKFVHWSGIDHFAVRYDLLDLPIIGIEHYPDVRMIQHIGKHARKAVLGHGLIRIREVTVITVGPRWYPRRHLCVKVRRIQAPLLTGVAAKEFFV